MRHQIVELCAQDIPEEGARDEELSEFLHTMNGYRMWGNFRQCSEVSNRVRALHGARALELVSERELRTHLFMAARAARHADVDFEELANEVAPYLAELRGRIEDKPPEEDAFEDQVFAAWLDGLERHKRLVATQMPRLTPTGAVLAAGMDGLVSWGLDFQVDESEESPTLVVLPPEGERGEALACDFKLLRPDDLEFCIREISESVMRLRGRRGLVMAFAYAVAETESYEKRWKTDAPLGYAMDMATEQLGRASLATSIFVLQGFRDLSAEWALIAWQTGA